MKSLPYLKSSYMQLIATAILAAGMGQSYAAVTIPNTFSAGTPAVATQVNDNFTAVKNAIDPLQISNYVVFGNLNGGYTTVTTAWTQLATQSTNTFTKSSAATKIEVHVSSNFSSGTFAGGASGIQFQVEVDGVPSPLAGGVGAILASNTTQYLSFYSVFPGLAAGPHTVSLWAKTPTGSSTNVLADPGGWGGTIIVKEAW